MKRREIPVLTQVYSGYVFCAQTAVKQHFSDLNTNVKEAFLLQNPYSYTLEEVFPVNGKRLIYDETESNRIPQVLSE